MVSIYVILLKGCTYFLHIFFCCCSKIKHTFFEGFCCLQGTVVTVDFSVFLDMSIHKNWVHKISSWKYLSEVLFSQFFPEHRMPHFGSLPWTPFKECWKSTAVSVCDLIFTEVYGKYQFVVDMLSLSSSLKDFSFHCHSRTWMCLAMVADLELQPCASPACLLENYLAVLLFQVNISVAPTGTRDDSQQHSAWCANRCSTLSWAHCWLLFHSPTLESEDVFILELSLHPLCIWSTLALFGIYLKVLTFWLICGSLG